MGIRKRGDKWLVTVELGNDELGVRRRAHATADTEEEAKRLEAKLQHDVYEGNHLKPSHETVASFCTRYLEDHSSSIAPSTRGLLRHLHQGSHRARSRPRGALPLHT